MKKTIILFICLIFLISCKTTSKLQIQVPELKDDAILFDDLILDPKTNLDLLNNLNVLEILYANQKVQTYNLMVYISQLANDKKAEGVYRKRISDIYDIYQISL